MAADLSRQAILADYATVLEWGFTSPAWSKPGTPPALDPSERAWLDAVEAEAEKDGIRVVAAWDERFDGFHIVCSITSPRHDRSYGLPRAAVHAQWQQRYQRDWGQRLKEARRRVAADQEALEGD